MYVYNIIYIYIYIYIYIFVIFIDVFQLTYQGNVINFSTYQIVRVFTPLSESKLFRLQRQLLHLL